MSDTQWDHEFENRIAQYIDATDEGLEELQHEVGSDWFAELSKHVWSHQSCVRRRLTVLNERMLTENHHDR
jgi:hypothetical protein